MKKAAIFLCAVFLSGCATLTPWTELKRNEYKDGTRKFEAEIPRGWMRSNFAKYFMITKDGILLENISVRRHWLDEKLEFTKKTFDKNMTLLEIAEVEIDNFKANENYKDFELLENKPTSVDGREASFLEYKLTMADGLKIRGMLYDAYCKKFIYRIQYEAAEQHYFEKYLSDFYVFVKSLKIIDEDYEREKKHRQGIIEASFVEKEQPRINPVEDSDIPVKTEPEPTPITTKPALATYAEYYRALYNTISDAVVKPEGARGTVNASLTILADGVLEKVEILEGSAEDSALRAAVEEAIRNSAPFPPFPDDIKAEGKKTITITIEFRKR